MSSSDQDVTDRNDRLQEKKQNKTVSALADKLQQGWAMLAQHCPQCHTPLVREKGGTRIYCVSCEMWVVREQDLDPTQRQQLDANQPVKLSSASTSAAATTAATPISSPTKSSLANLAFSPAQQKDLESGLASLSDHRSFQRVRSELQAENDGETAPASTTSNKTTSSLDAYERSKLASKKAAAEEEEEEYVLAGEQPTAAELAAHSKRMDELSKKLGAKMLQGWTLLGDICPNEDCMCPLMRQRGETNMVCVNCESTVAKEGEQLVIVKPGNKVPVGSPATVASASTAAPTSTQPQPKKRRGPRQTRRQREEDWTESEEEEEEEDHRNEEQKTYVTENRLRQALAGSSKETDDEEHDFVPSPTAPIIGSGSIDINDPYRLNDLPTDLSDPVLTKKSLKSSTSAAAAAAERASENVSAKLGEKMMQGYALLAQHCPRDNCNCPLVRKKDGPMLCVKCGSTVVDQADYSESIHGRADNLSSSQSADRHSVKRLASPSLNELREEESQEKKNRSTEEPSFQNGLFRISPQVRSPVQVGQQESSTTGSNSASSSGLPSPSGTGSRSRALSMELESPMGEVDPRLKQLHSAQAQLGGKSGRFHSHGAGPHSRAPSLAVANTSVQSTHHTSSAALNAATQFAFGGASGATKRVVNSNQRGRANSDRGIGGRTTVGSDSNSSEQSPMNTPPATPNVPYLGGGGSFSSFPRYPQSRHPSINVSNASVGGGLPPQFSTGFATGSRNGSFLSSPQVKFALNEADEAAAAADEESQPTSRSSSLPNFNLPQSAATAAASGSIRNNTVDPLGILFSTLDTLARKVDETRHRLSLSMDGEEIRDLTLSLRELMPALQTATEIYHTMNTNRS